MAHVLILATHRAAAAARLIERVTAQLAAAACPGDIVVECRTVSGIWAAMQRRPDIVLAPLVYEGDGGFRAAVAAVRHAAPAVLIVACCDVSVRAEALLVAEQAGVDHFAVPAVDDVAAIVRGLTGPASDRGQTIRAARVARADALDELLAALPTLAARLLTAAVSPRPPGTVQELATGVGLAERTLTRRCARAGWPTPRKILRYGRLLRGLRVAMVAGDLEAGAIAAGCSTSQGRAVAQFRTRLAAATGEAPRVLAVDSLATLCAVLAERFGAVSGRRRMPSVRARPGGTKHRQEP